jgi:hypothetical protein
VSVLRWRYAGPVPAMNGPLDAPGASVRLNRLLGELRALPGWPHVRLHGGFLMADVLEALEVPAPAIRSVIGAGFEHAPPSRGRVCSLRRSRGVRLGR